MSELVREALRSCKREGWRNLLEYGKAKGPGASIKSEDDVVLVVREVRQNKRRLKIGTK